MAALETLNNNVCRDFLRNVCTRGSRCKFSHPQHQQQQQQQESQPEQRLQDAVIFCHDFQNLECSRPKCRFLHCSRDEEEEFRASGYLPPSARDQALRKGIAPDLPTRFGETPICKDFLGGDCKRGPQCRYRHVSPLQYDREMHRIRGVLAKRPKLDAEDAENVKANDKNAKENGNNDDSVLEKLRRENDVLKRTVETLKKRVSDLNTTNEFLLEQNAQLRLGDRIPKTVSTTPTQQPVSTFALQPISAISAATPATLSIATAPPQPQAPQPQQHQTSTISIATAAAPQPQQPISIAQPTTLPISLTAAATSVPSTFTMAALAEAPLPTVSLPVQPTSAVVSVPVQELSAAAAAPPPPAPAAAPPQPPPGAPQGAAQPPPPPGQAGPPQAPPGPPPAVVQETTRLVTYPITSIRQQI